MDNAPDATENPLGPVVNNGGPIHYLSDEVKWHLLKHTYQSFPSQSLTTVARKRVNKRLKYRMQLLLD
jgi:hypothetical protein